MNDVPIAGLTLLSLLAIQFMNFVKVAKARDVNGIVSQAGVWAVGIGSVWLFAVSQFGDTAHINHISFAHLDSPTKLLVGFVIGSLAHTGFDLTKVFDTTQSAAKPPLIGDPAPPSYEQEMAGLLTK